MKFFDSIRGLFRKAGPKGMRGAHFPSGVSWMRQMLNGSRIDFASRVTDPAANSAVAVCLGFIVDNWMEAPLCLKRAKRGGGEETIWDHPLLDLMRRPNPWYSARVMWSALIPDLLLEGNAYLQIIRDRFGLPVALYWMPTGSVEPRRLDESDDTAWIDYYEYTVAGKLYKVPFRDVLHFREGIDRDNPRKGCARFRSVLAETYTDNEAALTVATVLTNRAIPALIISPSQKESKTGFTEIAEFSDEQQEEIGTRIDAKFTGDGRGRAAVFSVPMSVEQISANLADLASRDIRRLPEERICAIFGIPPGVVKLGAGLDRNTMSNADTEKRQAWESGMIPKYGLVTDVLTLFLLPQMEARPEKFTTSYDTAQVAAMQENTDDKAARLTSLWKEDVITHDEARNELAYAPDPERVGKYYSQVVTASLPDPNEPPPDDPEAKAMREALSKAFLDEHTATIHAAAKAMREALSKKWEARRVKSVDL